MLIANPIYDTVFKRLMENKRIAKFFVETLIGEKVEEIALVPQEYTYKEEIETEQTEQIVDAEINGATEVKKKYETYKIMRLDFVATIRTEKGEYKKILIEIQKSSASSDLLRFRKYLGEQYQRLDMVEIATGKVEKSLPIVCIYLLGFKVTKTKIPAIKVNRTYLDMIGEKQITQKIGWLEALTHDGYFVQIPHIKGKPRTALEKLLSVFEQEYFINREKTLKGYEYPIDDENVKAMVDVLCHAAADPKTKRDMEEAWYAELNEREYQMNMAESKKLSDLEIVAAKCI